MRANEERPSSRHPIQSLLSPPHSGRRRRPIPDQISRYYIPLPVLEATDRVMRRLGQEERECYVWWGGYFNANGDGQVVTALCPEIHTEFGRIHLGTRELAALHSRLRTLDQILLVELHTHPPRGGGQNQVDAAHPAATYLGFITVVVPDFAFPHFYDLRTAYVYEYINGGRWHELSREEVTDRFVVEESSVIVKMP